MGLQSGSSTVKPRRMSFALRRAPAATVQACLVCQSDPFEQ
jgi:hypothetical protein